LEVHPKCGGAVQRLISPSAFHFKGTGWYVTDYKKKGNGKSLPDTQSASAEGKPEGKNDSKTANGKSDSKKETTADKSASSSKPAESPKTA